MLALEGRQLGNYDVVRRIRVGGMGAVYEGRQRTAFDRRVAIKVILGNYAVDREMRRRFAREARTIARLHHPHILPLIEFGDERNILYLVMPYIEGGTLTGYLQRSLPGLDDVSSIYQQLLDAVEYAHDQGLIHRDIKSSNVLMEERRNAAPYVYLADFGLVRTAQQSDNEPQGVPIPLDQVPGTPHYMAPEQTIGIVTPLTDIYALGVLLYQLLTGELPYDDPDEIKVIQMHLHAPVPSPVDTDPSLPEALAEVVRTAMAKRPEDRYRNVAELRQAFLAALAEKLGVFDADELAAAQDFAAAVEPPPHIPSALELEPRLYQKFSSTQLNVRLRTTGSVIDKQRTTESVPYQAHHKHRHGTLPILAAALVPIVLLVLVLMPRLLGVSLFPSGFPVLGSPPVAVVSLTEETKALQDTYILTASQSVTNADLATRIIPDRTARTSTTGSGTTRTTGSRTDAGTQASGVIHFENGSDATIPIPAGTMFTATNGVAVQTTQSVVVPPVRDGQSGAASASALAVNAGVAGNIPAHALATTCCNGILVSNSRAFTGGVDGRNIAIVTQADVDRLSSQLTPGVEQQALKQLQKQLKANEVMADKPTYTPAVTASSPVGAASARVTVRVSVSAAVVVYDGQLARHVAGQLLNNEAAQTFGASYQVQDISSTAPPHVVEQGQNGQVYLSVSAKGTWAYRLLPQQLARWGTDIKGATPDVAIAYLNAQKGVAGVQVQLPFGADHIPASTDQIKMVIVQR